MPGIFGGGGGSDAGAQAAAAQQAANAAAIEEQRRQFGITQENVQPFLEAGTGALPGVVEGATAEGLGARLSRIFNTDIFKNLVGERERGVRGQLAAGGLTRSGTAIQEAANIPTQIGLALEGLLTGRGTALAQGGQNAALNLGQLGAGTSGNISQLLSASGGAQASGILTDQQASAQRGSNTLQLLGTAATAAAIFFSDPSLKENVEEIGMVCDLSLMQWDWIPETKGTLIEKCGTTGFMADEVAEKYPQHVAEFCGFMVIDYPALLDELSIESNACH